LRHPGESRGPDGKPEACVDSGLRRNDEGLERGKP
jgi:hypothetical protein